MIKRPPLTNLKLIHITVRRTKPPNRDNYKVIVTSNMAQLSCIRQKLMNCFQVMFVLLLETYNFSAMIGNEQLHVDLVKLVQFFSLCYWIKTGTKQRGLLTYTHNLYT